MQDTSSNVYRECAKDKSAAIYISEDGSKSIQHPGYCKRQSLSGQCTYFRKKKLVKKKVSLPSQSAAISVTGLMNLQAEKSRKEEFSKTTTVVPKKRRLTKGQTESSACSRSFQATLKRGLPSKSIPEKTARFKKIKASETFKGSALNVLIYVYKNMLTCTCMICKLSRDHSLICPLCFCYVEGGASEVGIKPKKTNVISQPQELEDRANINVNGFRTKRATSTNYSKKIHKRWYLYSNCLFFLPHLFSTLSH